MAVLFLNQLRLLLSDYNLQ